jgi:hypothetical protein
MYRVLQYVGPAKNSDGQETVNYSQHMGAVIRGRSNALGLAMRKMLEGWEDYAREHKARYDSKIGEDGALGRYWAETGLAIKRLLDGETGGLDCGSIAHNITALIQEQGFKTDGYTLTD